QRIELMATIAEAVNAAHLNGVIHRDLKPGNICVKSSGQPVILDFGLAKRTLRGTEEPQNHLTETGAFVGSLPWASPEQAEGEANIDVRTDVYSLGVVAYQLLTGEFPYDVTGSITRTARQITTSDPAPPCKVNPALDDEIATILLKALKKKRDERYQNAGDLGRDIRRYLAGDPIEAKGDSLLYWLRKQFARHKIAVAVASAFTSVVLIGLFVSIYYWQTAEAARQVASDQKEIAEQAATDAQTSADQANAVTEFLVDIIASSDPNSGGRSDVTVKEMMHSAVRELKKDAVSEKPEVEASIRAVIGKSYASLGLFEEARKQSEESGRLFKQSGDIKGYVKAEAEAALALCNLERLDEALDRFQSLHQLTYDTFGDSPELSPVLQGRARVFKHQGKIDEAESDLRQAIDLLSDDVEAKDEYSPLLLNDLAAVLTLEGKHQEAMQLVEASLKQLDSDDSRRSLELTGKVRIAMDLARQRQFDEAISLMRKTIKGMEELAGPRSPVVASCKATLGNILSKANRYEESLPLFMDSLSIRQELLGENHTLVAASKNGLAIVAFQAGNLDQAEALLTDAIEVYTEKRGPDHPELATILGNLAAVHRAADRMDKALASCRRALEINQSHFGSTNLKTADSMHRVGRLLQETGKPQQAIDMLSQSLETRKAQLEPDDLIIAETKDALALAYADAGKLDEALKLSQEVFQQRSSIQNAELMLLDSQMSLSVIYFKRKEYEQSLEMAKAAIKKLKKAVPESHWRLATFRAHYAKVLNATGKTKESRAILDTAIKLVDPDIPDSLLLKLKKSLDSE
ncbi:MAG: serine/threonine-protein kinase, partial [Planctomycetota bacterium]